MKKFLMRIILYSIALYGVSLITNSVRFNNILSFVLTLFVLFIVNLILRPVLLAIAIPINIFTFGIVSVFVNMLTIIIAKAFVQGAVIEGFWPLAVVAVLIMVADSIQRKVGKHCEEG